MNNKTLLNSLYGETMTERVINIKSEIKEYMNCIVYDLALNDNLDYSKLKNKRFEIGEICACIDILNRIIDGLNVSVSFNPNLTFYKNGERIVINDI